MDRIEDIFNQPENFGNGELLLTFDDIKEELILNFDEIKLIEECLYEKPTDSNRMMLYQKFSKIQCPFLYKCGDTYQCFWSQETDRCIECYKKYPRNK